MSGTLSRRSFAQILGSAAAVAAVAPMRLVARPNGHVRLSSNENPYGVSPLAAAAMREAMALAPYYPDQAEEELVAALAKLHGVSPEQILLGAGSSEILRFASLTFLSPSRRLVMADPTFELIGRFAEADGADVVRVPLTGSFAHDLDRMAAVKDAGLFYICNPNNPTATLTTKGELQKFIESVPSGSGVLVDEAYHHYATSDDYASVIPLIASHPNLIVARTFSKIYAMAGLRCGYAVAQRDTIARMAARQTGNTISCVALAGARASLDDAKWAAEARRRNEETRRWLVGQLSGHEILPSHANFVMINVRHHVRPHIVAMRERGVRVGRVFPALPQHMRVTIGTPEQMQQFVETFRSLPSLR
jgi:histidinol-phosphate aminotransferase